jgi:hypothetical protein
MPTLTIEKSNKITKLKPYNRNNKQQNNKTKKNNPLLISLRVEYRKN